MMNDKRTPSDARAETAARWRAKLDGDDATEGDWLAYEEWLSAAPENRAAAQRLDEALADIELNKAAIVAAEPQSNVTRLPIRRWFARPAVWAASAAAIAAGALFFVVAPPPTTEFAYAAPADHDRLLALPDGTRVHLNRGASVHVRYGSERHVDLAQGEASFDVRHDPSRPFEVAAGGVSIRDIGTEFNVARNAESLVVTVRSGEVELAAAAGSARVRAGQQARFAGGVIAVASAQANDAFAWQSGHLVYHDAPLSAVLEDLSRYSAKPIVLAPGSAANLRFSGILVIGEPRAMLAHLQSFLPIRASDEDNRIVVRSST